MGMAMKLADYLRSHPVDFELVSHPHSASSLQSARAMKLPAGCVAKAVVLEDEDDHFLMAVLPASRKVWLDALRERTGRKLRLASEEELRERFDDCALGAVPPVGGAYSMETVWDETLTEQSDVYFEAGDHQTLVHLKMRDFVRLLEDAHHMALSEPMAAGQSKPLF